MAKKTGGLGRGFDSLIPTDFLNDSFDVATTADAKQSDLRYVKTTDVHPDDTQPRRHFEEEALDELAASITEHGILQPLVVMPAKDGDGYTVIAGERRWRAAGLAGLKKVPVIVRTPNDQHRLEISLIENVQRRDLSPLETAAAYVRLRDQFNLSLEAIGQRIGGKSQSAISNTMRLLNLPVSAKQAIADGHIGEGHARPLLAIADRPDIDKIVARIVKEGWSVRRIEEFVNGEKRDKGAAPVKAAPVRYDTYSQSFSESFGTKVTIKPAGKSGGKVTFAFKDDADLERIKSLLK